MKKYIKRLSYHHLFIVFEKIIINNDSLNLIVRGEEIATIYKVSGVNIKFKGTNELITGYDKYYVNFEVDDNK